MYVTKKIRLRSPLFVGLGLETCREIHVNLNTYCAESVISQSSFS